MEMIEYNVLKAIDNDLTVNEIHVLLAKIAKQYDIGAFSFQITWSSWKSDGYKLHRCVEFGLSAKTTPEEKTKWEKIAIEVNKTFPGAKALLLIKPVIVEPIHEGAHK